MKRLIYAILILCCTFSCIRGRKTPPPLETAAAKDTVYPLGFCTDSFRVVQGSIATGDNFTSWLTALGLTREQTLEMAQRCDSVFDVRKLRAGNSWSAYYADSARLSYVVYDNSKMLVSLVFEEGLQGILQKLKLFVFHR